MQNCNGISDSQITTDTYKTLHTKDRVTLTPLKLEVNSGVPEKSAIPVLLVAPVGLL
jgi:hypothetical protein